MATILDVLLNPGAFRQGPQLNAFSQGRLLRQDVDQAQQTNEVANLLRAAQTANFLSQVQAREQQAQQVQRDQARSRAIDEVAGAALAGDQQALELLGFVDPERRSAVETTIRSRTPEALRAADVLAGRSPEDRERTIRARRELSTPQTVINVPGQETERDKALGKAQAASVTEAVADLRAARDTRTQVGQFRALQQRFPQTGTFGRAIAGFGNLLEALPGVDASTINVDIGAAAGLSQLSTQFALGLVQQTKGAISDAEMRLFLGAVPGLAQSPQGNEVMLDYMDRVSERAEKAAQIRLRGFEQGKSFSEVEAEVDELIASEPLFTEDEVQQLEPLISGSQAGVQDLPPGFQSTGETVDLDAFTRRAVQDRQLDIGGSK